MPQLLLEFFSEEIPARMQKRAEEELARALSEKLKAAGLNFESMRAYSTPRRLAAVVEGLPAKAADVSEEKKGPRVGAPEAAVQGFVKSAGLKSISEAEIVEDKKGAYYVARIARAGRAMPDILREIVPDIVRGFPWPKSMRSGSSDLTWVRPLHNVLCLFDGAHVKIEIDGAGSKPVTWGHRFHAPAAIEPKDTADYAAKLRAAYVEIDRDARKARILAEAKKLCAASKLELVEDAGLLEEVAGLAEWPVVLKGDMDPRFLDLPAEVIRLSMRTHQKYFAVRDPQKNPEGTQKLAPHFIVVANIEAKDGGKAIAAGNARVLSARLNDARFFWETDKKTPLFTEERREKLKKIVFHQKLGSVWDKVERVKALAVELCAVTGADKELVKRAAELCKMDLVTETVGEFPELQGQVGRQLYLAELNAPLLPRGEGVGDEGRANAQAPGRRPAPHPPAPSPQGRGGESIAAAIEDHYRPLGPNDRVPTDPVAVTLALADKLDTLVGFWAIDERPTGSSDPYALRRAALGFVRIVLERQVRFDSGAFSLWETFAVPAALSVARFAPPDAPQIRAMKWRKEHDGVWPSEDMPWYRSSGLNQPPSLPTPGFADGYVAANGVMEFLYDRLRVTLRDKGYRHDLLDAVFALELDFEFVSVVARVEALDAFLKTEDGANLLSGYKRAANILAAEEKKGRGLDKENAALVAKGVDAKLLAEPAERALAAALDAAIPQARAAVEKEDFAAAMKALAALRAPVDAFFEKVLVNAEDASLRRNRLLLLSRLVEATAAVADFSKIEG